MNCISRSSIVKIKNNEKNCIPNLSTNPLSLKIIIATFSFYNKQGNKSKLSPCYSFI